MKKILSKHGEKIAFVVVLLLCGFLVYSQVDAAGAASSTVGEIQKAASELSKHTTSTNVPEKYQFCAANAARVEGADKRSEHDLAATQLRMTDVPEYAAYLRPTRPKIDAPG